MSEATQRSMIIPISSTNPKYQLNAPSPINHTEKSFGERIGWADQGYTNNSEQFSFS